MLNPKIVYIAVAMVFIYIVARIKLVPYLAGRKILKDAKKNGTQQAQDMPSAALLPAQINPALYPPYPIMTSTAPPTPAKPERHDMYFEYRTVETITMDEGLVSFEQEAKRVELTVNGLIADIRKRGVCPDTLNIVQVSDGLLIVYATYTL